MKYDSASSIAMFFGTLSWLFMAVLVYVHAPLPVLALPALGHMLAVGLLAAWLWRSWLHVAWLSIAPHLLANLSCFAVVVFQNGEPAPWALALWTIGLTALSVAAAGVGAKVRAGGLDAG